MNRSLPTGLFLAWAVHDSEEWITGADWAATRLGLRMSKRHVRTAIGVMAAMVAAVSALGAATRGRSPAYRIATSVFGIHGVVHLLISVVVRGYSPGVITTPITVLPYSVVASRAANRAYGPLSNHDRALGILSLPVSLGLAQAAAGIINRSQARPQEPECCA